MAAMLSERGRSMWLSFAPLQPESFEQAIAKRLSSAAARSAVLPPRECPMTATREASIRGSVSIQSRMRESAQAQAESVAHEAPSRSLSFCTALNTPCAKPAPFLSAATLSNRNAAVAYPRETIASVGQNALVKAPSASNADTLMLQERTNAAAGLPPWGM